MGEQQAQSDRKREQMALDCKNIIQEQEKLRQLNQQLQNQVAALQNNPAQIEGKLENNWSPDVHAFDELI